MNLSNDVKIFGGIILATVVLIVGAVFFFGKDSGTSSNPTKSSKISSNILVRKDSWSEGPENAKVTMVEFGDFQCPACKIEEPIIESIIKKYQGKIRFVWRQFPLTQVHEFGMDSALAAEAAGKQGKFWEYHDQLFKISPDLGSEKLLAAAKELSLDIDKFTADKGSDEVRQKVLNDQNDGNRAKVNGTPTIFINGKLLINHSKPNTLPQAADFASEIDAVLK